MNIDWTTLLKSQQTNFINRLHDGIENLLTYEKAGIYGEMKTIAGKELDEIRTFCWQMVAKFRALNNFPQTIFVNHMKGKIGEKIVEKCLGDLVSRVRYDVIVETGDGKIDLTSDTNHNIGIQVKTRYASVNEVEWWISNEELEINQAIVCVLINKESKPDERFDEFKLEYTPIMAGFLPTNIIINMIGNNTLETESKNGESFVKIPINKLFHGSGLQNYLVSLTNDARTFVNLGDNYAKNNNFEQAIENYTKAINLDTDCAEAYRKRGIAYWRLKEKQKSIDNLVEATQKYLAQDNVTSAQEVLELLKNIQIGDNYSSASSNFIWKCIQTFDNSAPILTLAGSKDSQIFVGGSTDGIIKVWNQQTGELIHTISAHTNKINSVVISSDNEMIVSGSADRTMKVWNLKTGELIRKLPHPPNIVYGVSVSPDCKIIANGSSNDKVYLWNLQSDEELNRFSEHKGHVYSVAFSSDGKTLASCSSDRTIIIRRINSDEYFQTTAGEYWIRNIVISPDGLFLASSSDDGKIEIWDIDNNQLKSRCPLKETVGISQTNGTNRNSASPAIAISPDGKFLAGCGQEKNIHLWNLSTGELVHTLSEHLGKVTSITFIGSDSRTIATASDDNKIKIWHLT
ncbi:hypothetical protein WA1_12875 [Scytonema hofmannii PCC 7110]|uniref:Effector-associated domain-containing protein n=1 Tax=Scytonema hofmannii PCC 7110 TaxID=128403 RepID=A0A139XEG6_9CYAN|nr:tetratricopeptide repeat protein [Scytonema hofmannii]KYC42992.1 hypothetical protein WA1_12875 [Scytonema hofmannii PCC 7110]